MTGEMDPGWLEALLYLADRASIVATGTRMDNSDVGDLSEWEIEMLMNLVARYRRWTGDEMRALVRGLPDWDGTGSPSVERILQLDGADPEEIAEMLSREAGRS